MMKKPKEKIKVVKTTTLPSYYFDGSLIKAKEYIENLIQDGWENIGFDLSFYEGEYEAEFLLSADREETDAEFNQRLKNWEIYKKSKKEAKERLAKQEFELYEKLKKKFEP